LWQELAQVVKLDVQPFDSGLDLIEGCLTPCSITST
jgi:hypothetical protein